MEKKYQTLTITIENVSQAQAIAFKKMFKYMETLGHIGSSRMCSYFADGDGEFHPKIKIDYPEELPEVKDITGIESTGDFVIDFDEIAWKIYH